MRSRSKMTGNGLAGDSRSVDPAADTGPASRAPADVEGREDGAEAGGAPQARRPGGGSRRGLKNWRVRSRLVLLIAIPTLTAVVLGGTGILSYARSATADGRVQQLAALSANVTVLAQRLEDERDQTVRYIGLGVSNQGGRGTPKGGGATELNVVKQQQALTDQTASVVRGELSQINGSFPAQTQLQAATARTALLNLRYLRAAATGSQLPALVVVQKYATVIEELLGLIDVTGQGASDATLGQAIRVLGLVSRMKEEASEQRAILTYGLLVSQLNPNELTALNSAVVGAGEQPGLVQLHGQRGPAQRVEQQRGHVLRVRGQRRGNPGDHHREHNEVAGERQHQRGRLVRRDVERNRLADGHRSSSPCPARSARGRRRCTGRP